MKMEELGHGHGHFQQIVGLNVTSAVQSDHPGVRKGFNFKQTKDTNKLQCLSGHKWAGTHAHWGDGNFSENMKPALSNGFAELVKPMKGHPNLFDEGGEWWSTTTS